MPILFKASQTMIGVNLMAETRGFEPPIRVLAQMLP
jgi:hypothetical protein